MWEYAPAPESRAIANLKPSYRMFVDGEFVEGAGQPLKTINPATEEVLAEVSTASTAEHWERDFGARQQAVTEAMTRRYGPEALAASRATWAPSVACRETGDPRWRARYTRLLRLLETRLSLAGGRES